jgi:hypothetical protein
MRLLRAPRFAGGIGGTKTAAVLHISVLNLVRELGVKPKAVNTLELSLLDKWEQHFLRWFTPSAWQARTSCPERSIYSGLNEKRHEWIKALDEETRFAAFVKVVQDARSEWALRAKEPR